MKIRESWEAYFAEFEVLEAASFIDDVVVTGDRAFAYGHYTSTAHRMADGTIYHESGRFAEVLVWCFATPETALIHKGLLFIFQKKF